MKIDFGKIEITCHENWSIMELWAAFLTEISA